MSIEKYNLAIKPTKTFLAYPSVALLGQKVDSLGLSTAEEKLAAINKLTFPRTLKALETYLGMTGWLRNYVAYYAPIVQPLQDRKTLMLRGAPNKGRARKSFSRESRLDIPSEAELRSFDRLQEVFREPIFLVHHDPRRRLYADVDASKKGFGAVVYHVEEDKDVIGHCAGVWEERNAKRETGTFKAPRKVLLAQTIPRCGRIHCSLLGMCPT